MPSEFIDFNTVRRQSFWNQWALKLSESLAHLVDDIMRRIGSVRAKPLEAGRVVA